MKIYLGDAVYADWDDATLSVTLTTEDGIRATNTIVLEPEVLDALGIFVRERIHNRQRVRPKSELRRERTEKYGDKNDI
jgi:hypothetical protein